MREGISTNRFCGSGADCLLAAGKQFVIRHHSRTTTTPQEAHLAARGGFAPTGPSVRRHRFGQAIAPADSDQNKAREET